MSDNYDLGFYQLRKANVTRCSRWHKGGLKDWSVEQWAVAVVGELGEACNAIKKLRRVEDNIANISADPTRQISSHEDAIKVIGEELADTMIYLDLPAARLGIDLAREVCLKFNKTSKQYGFPDELAMMANENGDPAF